jgi:hypothetical protein
MAELLVDGFKALPPRATPALAVAGAVGITLQSFVGSSISSHTSQAAWQWESHSLPRRLIRS